MVNWGDKVDVTTLPPAVQERLVNRRSSRYWEDMSPEEREKAVQSINKSSLSVEDVLDEVLSWEGIIGFTHLIKTTIDSCSKVP